MTHDLTRETLVMLERELGENCAAHWNPPEQKALAHAAECVRIVDAMLPCLTNRCDHYEWADCGQAMADAFNRSPLASAYAQARAAQGGTDGK